MDNGKAARPQWWSRPGRDEQPSRPVSLDKADRPERQRGSEPRPCPPPAGAPAGLRPTGPGAVPPVPQHPADQAAGPEAGERAVPLRPQAAPGPWGPPPANAGDLGAPLAAAGVPVPSWHRYDPWAPPGEPYPDLPGRPARRGRLLAGALLVALVAGGIGGMTGAYLQNGGFGTAINLPQAPPGSTARSRGTVAGIAAAALPGVVYIHVKGGGEEDTGTGVVLDTAGHILTNNHVVAAAASGGDISVTFDGGAQRGAAIVGRDAGYDLAVLKVDGVSGLRPLPLGNSDSVQVGDPVVAIGAPYGLEGTVTSGIVSAKGRPITAGGSSDGGGGVSYVDALQTDAPINPGNSGGPLMNTQGQVIGINSAIRSADGTSGDTGQGGSIGLGFAIPVNEARRVAEQLINTGRATHPVIGVTLDLGWSGDGARIAATGAGGAPAVTPGGPGDRAGLRPGDVITALDGQPLHSGDDLVVKIRSHVPGDRVTLTVRRGGGQITVRLVLGSSTGG